MIIGIDHGYYAIKTKNFTFPAGVTAYTHEPYTLKNTLQIGGSGQVAALLADCSAFEDGVIIDTIKALKHSMRERRKR